MLFDRLRGGVQDSIRGEGTHFLIPFFQQPIVYDIRTSARSISTVTGSKGNHLISFCFI